VEIFPDAWAIIWIFTITEQIWLVYSLFCLNWYIPMHMQITSSERIHKLTPLKFEDQNFWKFVNFPWRWGAPPPPPAPPRFLPLFTKCQRILLFIYVTTVYSVYLDFLHLNFSECRWRGCLGRCVHPCMLLIGASNPAMDNVLLFFVLIFFSLRFFLRLIAFTTQGSHYSMTVKLLNCPLLSKFDKLFFSRGHL
jgi:hypothetical protein